MGNSKIKNGVLSSHFDKSKITCSFLVPNLLYKRLTRENQKRIGKNLEYLLKKYKNRILKSKRIHRKTATSLYQDRGNVLIKFNVRIYPLYWEELTILSRSHGISNCYLYHLLLNWELSEEQGSFIIRNRSQSRNNQKLILVWMIDFKEEFSQRMAQILNEIPPEAID
ncbi:hypothetical protein A0128_16605 [Leptospira tipperaryensis]|uniref:CopG family transcriptional regulator n=1 Tax=Leptospira tipperaryensis TaxID=2564040 RepID=A0A1D7V0F8_9LEPT|nr:hypothetical protein A0128_16605 [Leptospira tipperaryensis]